MGGGQKRSFCSENLAFIPLYDIMPDNLNFTVTEPLNPQKLLAEAKEIIRYANLELSREAQGQGESPDKQQVLEGLQAIEQAFARDQAYFGQRLEPRHLIAEDFQERGVALSRDLKAKMEAFDFYHIPIPVTLFPRAGWAFTRLECEVIFCPGEPDPHQCPTLYEMFPENVWTEIFSLQTHLQIGLDGNLTFRA